MKKETKYKWWLASNTVLITFEILHNHFWNTVLKYIQIKIRMTRTRVCIVDVWYCVILSIIIASLELR